MNPGEFERHDEHYLRSITEMGHAREVVTNQAIFTNNNIKLVDKGTRIDSGLFERLVQHKLMPRFDQSFTVEDAVTHASLQKYARNLLDNDPGFAMLRACKKEKDRLLKVIDSITLLDPIAFKLTVAYCQRPEVFEHSMRVALVALHLAIQCHIRSERDLGIIATAALFHDIGILHVAPDLLRPGRRLEQSERHHLYAHPITGYLIFREYPDYHPSIGRAIFEHHERLDGSGYPRALKGKEISPAAQILMLAEVANTVFERAQESRSLAKISVLLRLNHKKFNRPMSNALLAMMDDFETAGGTVTADHASSNTHDRFPALAERLAELAQIFQTWPSARPADMATPPASSLFAVLNERIGDLHRSLLDAGFDTQAPAALLEALKEDAGALNELDILLAETRWQLAEIFNETHRRKHELADNEVGALMPVFDWFAQSATALGLT
ncbi:HD-GYP domain-containing protein [Propionivibrio limicola]|uniref:HD-GYP domain-containing protein n=1 Tax=Propionivibrio limicola TaxID=167645 RepID=UPI0012911640|nr:HD domain-containing phosphohydrolase [Propionivibrio limicola]